MAVHESKAVFLTLDAPLLAPTFLPLCDLAAGTTLLPSQCTLTVTGTPSPVEVAVMLCQPETALGDPGEAVVQVGDVFSVLAGAPFVLQGSVPALDAGGVLGLVVPVQALTPGATVEGTVSLVR